MNEPEPNPQFWVPRDIYTRALKERDDARKVMEAYHRDFHGTNIVWFEEAKKYAAKVAELTTEQALIVEKLRGLLPIFDKLINLELVEEGGNKSDENRV